MHASFAPQGVGNPGCQLHPQPRAQSVVKHTSVVTTGPPEHPAFPHAMVLTAYFVLSPVIGLVCHRRLRIKVCPRPVGLAKTSADLTPASRRQDHTTWPPRAAQFVGPPLTPTEPKPALRSDLRT